MAFRTCKHAGEEVGEVWLRDASRVQKVVTITHVLRGMHSAQLSATTFAVLPAVLPSARQ